jgi:hypothetical protein
MSNAAATLLLLLALATGNGAQTIHMTVSTVAAQTQTQEVN